MWRTFLHRSWIVTKKHSTKLESLHVEVISCSILIPENIVYPSASTISKGEEDLINIEREMIEMQSALLLKKVSLFFPLPFLIK